MMPWKIFMKAMMNPNSIEKWITNKISINKIWIDSMHC
jgi:hypothetical protein